MGLKNVSPLVTAMDFIVGVGLIGTTIGYMILKTDALLLWLLLPGCRLIFNAVNDSK
jgi:hypothetical protein